MFQKAQGKRTEWLVLQLTIGSLFWQLEILMVKPINWHSSVAPLLLLPNRFFCGYTLKIIQYAARQNQFYTGWWFQPFWKILVNGKDHPIYEMENDPFMFETTKQHISNHSPRQLRPKEPVDSSLLIRRIANGLQRFPNFRLVKAQVGQILRTKIAGDFQVFSWAKKGMVQNVVYHRLANKRVFERNKQLHVDLFWWEIHCRLWLFLRANVTCKVREAMEVEIASAQCSAWWRESCRSTT